MRIKIENTEWRRFKPTKAIKSVKNLLRVTIICKSVYSCFTFQLVTFVTQRLCRKRQYFLMRKSLFLMVCLTVWKGWQKNEILRKPQSEFGDDRLFPIEAVRKTSFLSILTRKEHLKYDISTRNLDIDRLQLILISINFVT